MGDLVKKNKCFEKGVTQSEKVAIEEKIDDLENEENIKIATLEEAISNLTSQLSDLSNTLNEVETSTLKKTFSIGSTYFSFTDSRNPNVILGFGEWQKIEGKFLLGASDKYEVGTEGGEETHKLTVEEMPSHSHSCTTVKLETNGSSIAGSGSIKYDFTKASTTGSKGGNKEHNNMPPYKAGYLWERIA